MSDAAPTSQLAPNRGGKAKRSKRKRKPKAQVVCQVCHKTFASITSSHLRTHGFTLARYRRAYGAPTRASGGSSPQPYDPTAPAADRQTVLTIAQRIVHDPDLIRELAGEVGEVIFSSSLRDQLRAALVGMVTARLQAHGNAVAKLQAIREEATQDWRIRRGGENGQPTPTKDLVALASVLGQEVKTGEELLLKTLKLAIEEYRSHKGAGTIEGGLPDRYTGDGEVLPVPAALTAQDRETIRTLWGMFDRAIVARRTVIDVVPEAAQSPAPQPEPGEASEPLPLLAEVQAPPPPEPVEGHPDVRPIEGFAQPIDEPTPAQGEDEPF